MAICDITIKKDIAPSCDDPIVPGLEQEGVIMNRADVDFGAVTFNATRKNVIETLALKTGKKRLQGTGIRCNPLYWYQYNLGNRNLS